MEETNNILKNSTPTYAGSKDAELTCFWDASKKAFAVVFYIKTKFDDGKTNVNLIFSKSTNAPKKAMSIPPLEMLVALIMARSLNFVSKDLGLELIKGSVWTGSQDMLNWIKTKKSLSVFVHNFVTQHEVKSCRFTRPRIIRLIVEGK